MTKTEAMACLQGLESYMLTAVPILTKLHRDCPAGIKTEIYRVLEMYLDTTGLVTAIVQANEG